MAETTYSYTISTDFPGGAVNLDKLTAEIQASSITKALERIDASGNAIDIIFKDALSAGEAITLDNDTTGPAGGLIAAHDNTATSEPATAVTVVETALTGGRFLSKGIAITVGASTAWYTQDLIFPAAIDMLSSTFYGVSLVDGDKVRVEVHPDFQLTAPLVEIEGAHSAGDANITVNITNLAAAVAAGLIDLGPGKILKFGSNAQEYIVKEIDIVSGWVKVHQKDQFTTADKGLTDALSDADAVKMTTLMLDDLLLPATGRTTIGASKVGGSGVPANTTIRLKFFNSDGAAGKKFYFVTDLLYGAPA